MMRRPLPLLLLLLLLFPIATSDDASAMLSLRDNLSPCLDWPLVSCSDSNRVTLIQLGHQGLHGTLPDSLRTLTQLQLLELQYNNISGPLPTLTGLSSLQVLILSNNLFSSIPPDFFDALTSLQTLRLDYNPFASWQIPPSLANSSSLQTFSADSANVTGYIPDFFRGFTRA